MILALGFLTGLALVAPVGPISLALIGIGTTNGRRPAASAASGVIAADVLIVVAMLVGASALLTLPDNIVAAVRIVLGTSLIAVGVGLVAKARTALAVVSTIRRPGRTLFAATLANPSTIAVWAGLATTALPSDRVEQLIFGAGLIAATTMWHYGVAGASAALGQRINDSMLVKLSTAAGFFVIALGATALLSA